MYVIIVSCRYLFNEFIRSHEVDDTRDIIVA